MELSLRLVWVSRGSMEPAHEGWGSATPQESSPYYYKLFRVRRGGGRVTTVAVDPTLVTKACEVMGGTRPVSGFIRQAALEYKEGDGHPSLSRFVQRQLKEALCKAAGTRVASRQ